MQKKKGKLGAVYTTEDGFVLAKPIHGIVGWRVEVVVPEERRIKVVYYRLKKGLWFQVGVNG